MAGSPARRYAQAAFALALEHEGIDQWEADLTRASEVCGDPDVSALLAAPQVPEQVKLDGIATLLLDAAPMVRNLVGLLVQHGDIDALPSIVEQFGGMADESRGVARAEVITAVPLDDQRRRRVIEGLARIVGRDDVTITERVDPEIIGGVIARVGDRLIDGSTRARLRSLRNELAVRPADVA